MSLICAAVFCAVGVGDFVEFVSLRVYRFLWNFHSMMALPAIAAVEMVKVAGIIYAVRLLLPLPLDSVAVPLFCIVDLLRGILGFFCYCREADPDNSQHEAGKVLILCTLAGQLLMVLLTSAYFLCA